MSNASLPFRSRRLVLTSRQIVDISNFKVSFNFDLHMDDGSVESFKEDLVFGFSVKNNLTSSVELLLDALHVALAINYYKPLLPEFIEASYESKVFIASFWEEVFRNGLGEFAYKNLIEPKYIGKFIGFNDDILIEPRSSMSINESLTSLVGIGGGKDSLVGWEVVGNANIRRAAFICESPSKNNVIRRDVLASVAPEESVIVQRKPDVKLDEMRKRNDAYRGHTPMSLIIALVGMIVCETKNYSSFLVSNESSSDEPNLIWNGFEVNHQWTKTTRFEGLFRGLLDYIGCESDYGSVLRPLTELGISRLFASMDKYHEVFFSCNKSLVDDKGNSVKWCGICAKCASSSLLLAPFMTHDRLTEIIGADMFNNKLMLDIFRSLVGLGEYREFDCILGLKEAQAVFDVLSKSEGYKDSYIVKSVVGELGVGNNDIPAIDELTQPKFRQGFPDVFKTPIVAMVKEGLGNVTRS